MGLNRDARVEELTSRSTMRSPDWHQHNWKIRMSLTAVSVTTTTPKVAQNNTPRWESRQQTVPSFNSARSERESNSKSELTVATTCDTDTAARSFSRMSPHRGLEGEPTGRPTKLEWESLMASLS